MMDTSGVFAHIKARVSDHLRMEVCPARRSPRLPPLGTVACLEADRLTHSFCPDLQRAKNLEENRRSLRLGAEEERNKEGIKLQIAPADCPCGSQWPGGEPGKIQKGTQAE